MILESADTAFLFGDPGQDAIMGCDSRGRRIERSHPCMMAKIWNRRIENGSGSEHLQ